MVHPSDSRPVDKLTRTAASALTTNSLAMPTSGPVAVAESLDEDGKAVRSRPLVLVVDDETDVRNCLCWYLEESFDVIAADNGDEAFAVASERLPDLIVSDVGMPKKDGLELCRDLRKAPATRDIPVVMLTGSDDEVMKLNCLASGATDFLAKPCSGPELVLRVRNLTQLYRQQQELAAQKQRLERLLRENQEKDHLLMRQEKLAGLGRMSAGLLHEINNPLNYALQALHFLRNSAFENLTAAEFSDVLSDVENGIHRVSRIVGDLREFTVSPNPINMRPVELAPLVEQALKGLSSDWKFVGETIVDIPAELSIRAGERQMVQVLNNLIKNARDATQSKVYTAPEIPRLHIRGDTWRGRPRLSIRDNGIGLPPEVREKIFDPFFTTKEVGKGMGLGLSICHAILTEHRAMVEVESAPNEFTEFSLVFPRVTEPEPPLEVDC